MHSQEFRSSVPIDLKGMMTRLRDGQPLTDAQEKAVLDVLLRGRGTPETQSHPLRPVNKIVAYRLRMRRLGVPFVPGPSVTPLIPVDDEDHGFATTALLLGPQLVVHELSDEVVDMMARDVHAARDGHSVPALFERSFLTVRRVAGRPVVTAVLRIEHAEWLDLIPVSADVHYGALRPMPMPPEQALELAKQWHREGNPIWFVYTWTTTDDGLIDETGNLACDLHDSPDLEHAVRLGRLYEQRARLSTSDDHRRASTPVRRRGRVEQGSVGWTVRQVSLSPESRATPEVNRASPLQSADSVHRRPHDGVEVDIAIAPFERWQPCGKGRKDRKRIVVRPHTRTVRVRPNVRVKVRP